MNLNGWQERVRANHLLVFASYFALACAIMNTPITSAKLALAFLGGLAIFASVYGYNPLTDVKEDNVQKKRTLLDFVGRRTLQACVLVTSLSALGISALLGIAPFIVALLILSLGFAYSHQKIRLKKYFFVKNVAIAIGWLLLFIYFSISLGDTNISGYLFAAYFMASLSFVGSMLRDIFDLRGDEAAGIHTIPSTIGAQATAQLVFLVTFLQYGILLVFVLLNAIPFFYLSFLATLPFRAGIMYAVSKRENRLAANLSLLSYPSAALLAFIFKVFT